MFKGYIVPVLIGIVGVAILCSLGNWQLNRLAWKEGILADIEARLSDQPVPVQDAIATDDWLYAPVYADGVTGERELHVLVSHKQLGPGYRVITSFTQDDGFSFLLDQGFIRIDDKDKSRDVLQGRIAGNLHRPDDRNDSTPENDVDGNIWFARDIGEMATILGAQPFLIVLREAEELDPSIIPLATDTSTVPNDHREYAITWFSLAAIWFGMTLFWLWRIRLKKSA